MNWEEWFRTRKGPQVYSLLSIFATVERSQWITEQLAPGHCDLPVIIPEYSSKHANCIGTKFSNILSTSSSVGLRPNFSCHRFLTESICVIIRMWTFLCLEDITDGYRCIRRWIDGIGTNGCTLFPHPTERSRPIHAEGDLFGCVQFVGCEMWRTQI